MCVHAQVGDDNQVVQLGTEMTISSAHIVHVHAACSRFAITVAHPLAAAESAWRS
jgi:hypothetical protein